MVARAFGERMSSTDSILWRIERDPLLRSTVTAVSLLDRSPDFERLRRKMKQASLRIGRMRQVVVEPPLGIGSPSWAEAESFDLDYHLRRVRLPQPTTFGAVLDYAAHGAMARFDPDRPLWEFTVVEGVGEGAVLIQKFHHAVTDGLGGMQLALEMLDGERKPKRQMATIGPEPPSRGGGSGGEGGPFPLARPLGTLAALARRGVTIPLQTAGLALKAGRDPLGAVLGVTDSVLWGARLLAPVSEPRSPVMRRRGLALGFAAFDVDLDRLRAAGRRVHGSLNDAFVAAVAAGLRRYHEAHGFSVGSLRMTLPISIRSGGDPLEGNRFTPVRFEIPLQPADPAVTVPEIGRLVRAWREGPALGLTDALARLLNALPTPAVTSIFSSMLRNVDFVATNVPGLPAPAYLAGAELLRQYAFAPPTGAAMNVALLSHVGHCCIGVNVDRAAVGDPEVLVPCLEEGFEEVLALAPSSGGRGVVAAGGEP